MEEKNQGLIDKDVLSRIPAELLVHIFKFLDKDKLTLAKCSFLFNDVSRTGAIWQDETQSLNQNLVKVLLAKQLLQELFLPVYERFTIEVSKRSMWSYNNNSIPKQAYLSKEEMFNSPPTNLKGCYKCLIKTNRLSTVERDGSGHLWVDTIKADEIFSYISINNQEYINPFFQHCLADEKRPTQTLGASSLVNGFSR